MNSVQPGLLDDGHTYKQLRGIPIRAALEGHNRGSIVWHFSEEDSVKGSFLGNLFFFHYSFFEEQKLWEHMNNVRRDQRGQRSVDEGSSVIIIPNRLSKVIRLTWSYTAPYCQKLHHKVCVWKWEEAHARRYTDYHTVELIDFLCGDFLMIHWGFSFMLVNDDIAFMVGGFRSWSSVKEKKRRRSLTAARERQHLK